MTLFVTLGKLVEGFASASLDFRVIFVSKGSLLLVWTECKDDDCLIKRKDNANTCFTTLSASTHYECKCALSGLAPRSGSI